MTQVLNSASAEQLAEILRAAGCRASIANQQGFIEIHSAVQGLGFFLRLGNADGAQRCLDFSWVCPLAVRGALPEGVIEHWNRGTRFAHLSLQGEFLVLSMDTVLAGGITEMNLRAQFEIWTRLLQQLVLHLRQPAAGQLAQAAAAA